MAHLKFISDKDLQAAINRVIAVALQKGSDTELQLHKNVIDPFSALFHGLTHRLTYAQWIELEKIRQSQKTLQNAIGDFHQDILSAIPNWKNLGFGGGLDIINTKKRVIAEVKNKFNTTKGNHRVAIYDSIKAMLKKPEFKGYVGYFVEVIPKGKNTYNKPFVPPDNKTKKRRPSREDIRIIDGVSFYALATGRKNALQELFQALPDAISEAHPYKLPTKETKEYISLFEKAFPQM